MASAALEQIIALIETAPRGSTIDVVRAIGTQRAQHFPPLTGATFTLVDAHGVSAEWADMPEVVNDRVILYLHGGAYISGSVANYHGFCSRLVAACGVRILAVDYRLAPEEPFPGAIEDAQAAYTWLLGQGYSPQNIAVMGDSAGGGLALIVALQMAASPLPKTVICISPWADLTASGESVQTKAADDPWLSAAMLDVAAQMYLNGGDASSPLVSPLFADFSRFPPLLILCGGREILLSDSMRVAERATAAGCDVILDIWYDMIHVFPIFAPLLPEAEHAIARIALYIKQHLRKNG